MSAAIKVDIEESVRPEGSPKGGKNPEFLTYKHRKKGGRPQLNMALPKDMVEAVDKEAERLSKKTGKRVSRTYVVEKAIKAYLMVGGYLEERGNK